MSIYLWLGWHVIYAIAIWKQPEAIAHQHLLKPLFFFPVCNHRR
ncbi:hypothetical protein [uncultured Nostoc sp.]